MINWRGQEIFFRGRNLDSQDFFLMAARVETSPAFHAAEPKLLFKVPGPIGGSSGTVSADGQRFVFAVNVPADKADQSSGLEERAKSNQPPGHD